MAKENLAKTFLLALVILAFGLRFYSGYKQYSGDVNNHIGWAQDIATNGYKGMYERNIEGVSIPNYPPLAMYGFSGSLALHSATQQLSLYLNEQVGIFPSSLIWWLEQKNTLALFMKIPAFVGDGLLALGVFLIFKNLFKSKNAGLWTLALLFNPAIFYVSAVWGQIESLVMALIIFAAYFARKKTIFYSVITFALATLTKQTALWLLPIFLLEWSGDYREAIRGAVVSFFGALVFYIPFYGVNAKFIGSYLNTLSGSSTATSDQAFNLWYFLVGMVDDRQMWGMMSIRGWSVLSLFACLLLVAFWYVRTRSTSKLWMGMWFVSMIAFFLQTRVHERHLYPAVVGALLLRTRAAVVIYAILSIYFMVNLYWSLGLSFI